MKPIIWKTKEEASKELKKRLDNSRKFRKQFESTWSQNEKALYNTSGRNDVQDARFSFESDLELGFGDIDSSNESVGVNYLFKNFRFIHAQLSANPPTVLARPTSTDPSDRKKADAADRIVRHAIRAEKMQEKVDTVSAKTLLYGTGWMKTVYDPHQGDIVDRDPKTGEFELEGKIYIYSPSTWDMWTDPNARCSEDIRFIFERKTMTLEEAIFSFPDAEDDLRAMSLKTLQKNSLDRGSSVELEEDTVEIFEYWEKGLPINGMLGRHAIILSNGKILKGVMPNPFSFSPPIDKEDIDPITGKATPMPPTAYLPYHCFTDIDMPDEIYGKSFIEYEAPIQDILNKLDSVTLDNIQAHGVARMVLPEGAEIAEDSLTNSPWDIIRIKGNQGPWMAEVPRLMPEMSTLRDRLKAGGDDMAGVNDSMFGQISRETSGFSLQYATNQGNMIRRRLFNKYVLFVESIYKSYLNLVRKHWEIPKVVQVLGEEKAFESIDIKGADIDGGFDIVVEYGASLSLDPSTRREELLQLMPLFEKAGVDSKTILSMMKLNELEGLYDIMQLSEERQREIFEEMIAADKFIEPRELEEHKGMLNYAYKYLMTAEFKSLDEDKKALIEAHVKMREQLAAGSVTGIPAMPMEPGPKGPMPQAGELPAATEVAPGEIPPPQPGTPGT